MVHPKDIRWWLCDDDVQTFVGKRETRVSGRGCGEDGRDEQRRRSKKGVMNEKVNVLYKDKRSKEGVKRGTSLGCARNGRRATVVVGGELKRRFFKRFRRRRKPREVIL